MSPFKKFATDNKNLLAIIVLSTFLKGLLLLHSPVVNPDATVYISAAQKHFEGLFAEGARYYRMPFYPLLLAAVHFVVPDWILAGQLLSALPLVLSLIPLYILTLRLFDKKSALAAALLFAVLPVFNEAGVEIIRDPLFLLFALSSLACLTQNQCKYSSRTLISAIFFSVLATLVRIEGVLFLFIVPTLFFWQNRYKFSLKKIITALTIALASLSSLWIALWALSLLGISSQSRLPEVTIWVKNIVTFDLFDSYHSLMVRLEEFQYQLPYGHLRNNILETTRHYAPLIYFVGLVEILIKEIWPISIIALWALRYRTKPLLKANRTIVIWPLLAFLLLDLLFCLSRNFITTRYVWIPIVLLIPFIGHGISLLWNKMTYSKVALTGIVMLLFIAPIGKTLAEMDSDRPSIRQAAKWLNKADPKKQLSVLFNDSRLSLYTDRIYAPEHNNAFNMIKRNKDWRPKVDLLILDVNEEDLKNLPLPGFHELKRFKDNRTTILILEREKKQNTI